MTELIIVRHGETAWNREGRFQGHHQTELNAIGRQQVERLAQRLAVLSVHAIYSSDLLRARQTADAIVSLSGLPIGIDPRLREWHLGVLAGLTREVAQREHPQDYAIYRDQLVDSAITDGESIRQRYQRSIHAMQAIAARHSGRTVVIVTHGGPLGVCYRRAIGMPLEAAKDFQLYNAAINRFEVEGECWQLLSWADTAHLEGVEMLGNWAGPQ